MVRGGGGGRCPENRLTGGREKGTGVRGGKTDRREINGLLAFLLKDVTAAHYNTSGNPFCGRRRPPPSPKGYCNKALDERVTSLTAMYLKRVTAPLHTPSPQPPARAFSLRCPFPAVKSAAEGGAHAERAGTRSCFSGNLHLTARRTPWLWRWPLVVPGHLKAGQTTAQTCLFRLADLSLFIAFFPAREKRKKHTSKRNFHLGANPDVGRKKISIIPPRPGTQRP